MYKRMRLERNRKRAIELVILERGSVGEWFRAPDLKS